MRTTNRLGLFAVAAALFFLLLAVPLIAGCAGEKGGGGEAGSSTGESAEENGIAEGEQPVDVDTEAFAQSEDAAPSASEQAIEQAKAEGKPVLLKFGSGTCQPCIEIDRNIEEVRPGYEGRVAFVIVNVNDRSEYPLCMEYGLQTIPTTVFIKSDGTPQNGFVGVMTADQLREQLDSLLSV